MPLPSLDDLLNNKVLVAASAVCGAGLTKLIEFYKRRVRVLDYTVTHTRVALATEDALFGSIQVTWEGNPVTSLYVSRVELANQCGVDLTDLKIAAYTGTTLFLGQRTEVVGTPYALQFTDDYAQQVKIEPGLQPTPQQRSLYHSRREYKVPVLNRNQRIALTYLTTVPPGEQPAVFLDTAHLGLKLQYREQGPMIAGVPLKTAIISGLGVSVFALVAVLLFVTSPAMAGTACLLVGLCASVVGAFVVRAVRLVKTILLH